TQYLDLLLIGDAQIPHLRLAIEVETDLGIKFGESIDGSAIQNAEDVSLRTEIDVLCDREIRNESKLLRDHRDSAALREPGVPPVDRRAVNHDLPLVCGIETSDDLSER